jgi:hypothetical protein
VASDQFLSSCDVALLNLVAARGLPGTDSLNIEACLDKLDRWAARVRIETMRHLYRFDSRAKEPPSEFRSGNSLGRFLCYFLLQVLQEDCGVSYNPERKCDPDFCQPADLFIHGIVGEKTSGGTCATMPVVYVAVGRRLGYPLKLVEGRGHVFFRWDDRVGSLIRWPNLGECWIPPDRFNVEGAGEGIAYHPDSYYIQWPQLWNEIDFSHGRYLRSMSAKEELASFLIQRGECFWDIKQPGEAMKAYWFARKLAPDDTRYEWLHSHRTREYQIQNASELAEINERSRRNRLGAPLPARNGGIIKIAFGTPIPTGLPPGTAIQYVPAEQADRLPDTPGPGTGASRHLRGGSGQPFLHDRVTSINEIREQNRRLLLSRSVPGE